MVSREPLIGRYRPDLHLPWILLIVLALGGAACGGTTANSGPAATVSTAATARDPSDPGEPQAEPATFHSLGIRWPVRGDANSNAVIAVHYRRRGAQEWTEALPLFRTNPDALLPEFRIPGGWLFAGSIVDLSPGTEYEVALSLTDPDGGETQRRLLMRTGTEPKEPPGMRVRHVVPLSASAQGPGAGTANDPFRGLKAAQATAAPGDLFLLHAGVYAEGTWVVDRHGTADAPIIYRGAEDGAAILDGGGAQRLISANAVQHVWFEHLTFRNARYLFVGHSGSHFVIRRVRLEVVETGITAINGGYTESRGFVITDNDFQGPTSWPRSLGIEDVNGVTITGAGHVVAYNRMRNLGDGIHGSSAGGLSASDIYNNDIEASTDDGIEADYGDINVRVYRNRITNAFSGISSQPTRGGPLYVFRNAIYNVVYSPFKLHNDTSGVFILHNTSAKAGIPFHIAPGGETVSDVITRNNLFLGTEGPALLSTGKMIRCGFDGDGYGWLGGLLGRQASPGAFAYWNGQTYASADAAKRSGRLYWRQGATVLSPRGNFLSRLDPPANSRKRYLSAETDLRLDPASRAIDAGVPLPNFNDSFTGMAPDLGCCELDQPLPHYGVRP